jgi:soluble lytic murein transglycosylase-like protein
LPHGLTFALPYVQEAWNDALAAKISPGYFVRQMNVESHFNPRAISATGAIGIAQFLPATARSLPNPLGPGRLNPWDPHQSLLAAARSLAAKARQYGGDYAKALAAFHAGDRVVHVAVRAAATAGLPVLWSTYLPEETRQYLDAVLGS